MIWKKKRLRCSKLYLILDTQVCDYDRIWRVATEAVDGGVDIVQLRDKQGTAKDILKFSEKFLRFTRGKVLYIINDRIDLAIACEADGVHLGQDDLSLEAARKIGGEKISIGISCQTWAQVQKAQEQGADYIGFGSVFKTLTKPDRDPMDLRLLAKVIREAKIPVFPIGGINMTNMSDLQSIGVKRAAVCRAIMTAKDIRQAVLGLRKKLDEEI